MTNDPSKALFSGTYQTAEQSSNGSAAGVSNPNVAKASSAPITFCSPVPSVTSISGHPHQRVEPENVAANTSQTPMSFDSQTTTSYELSNAEATHQNFSFGMQGNIAAQPPMTPQGTFPGFTKLSHAAMPVIMTVPGTDYKP